MIQFIIWRSKKKITINSNCLDSISQCSDTSVLPALSVSWLVPFCLFVFPFFIANTYYFVTCPVSILL